MWLVSMCIWIRVELQHHRVVFYPRGPCDHHAFAKHTPQEYRADDYCAYDYAFMIRPQINKFSTTSVEVEIFGATAVSMFLLPFIFVALTCVSAFSDRPPLRGTLLPTRCICFSW